VSENYFLINYLLSFCLNEIFILFYSNMEEQLIHKSEEEGKSSPQKEEIIEKVDSKELNLNYVLSGSDVIQLEDQNEDINQIFETKEEKNENPLQSQEYFASQNDKYKEEEKCLKNQYPIEDKIEEINDVKAIKEETKQIQSKKDKKIKGSKCKPDKTKLTKTHQKYVSQMREPTIYEKALEEMIKEGKLQNKTKSMSVQNVNEPEKNTKSKDQNPEQQTEKIASKDMKAKLDLLLQLKNSVYNMQLSDAVDRAKIQKLERENKEISDKIRNIEQQIGKIEKAIDNDNPYMALQEEQLAKLKFSKNEKAKNESSAKLNDKLTKLIQSKESSEKILNNLSNISTKNILDKLNDEYKKSISNIKKYNNKINSKW